jgi:hypothetical protein
MCGPEYYDENMPRQLAEERLANPDLYPMPEPCTCTDSSHDQKMWLEPDGEMYLLQLSLSREDLYNYVQVEMMSRD